MKLLSFKTLALAAVLTALAPAASAVDTVTDPDKPRALPAEGPVSVSWDDPAKFSDLRHSFNRWEAERGDWVRQLALHVRKSTTKQLQPGERLEVTITDVMRAGIYEPWHGPQMDHVRVVRDRYPPRMELNYTLYGADGQVLAQGSEKLRDFGFMMGSSPINDSDPLRHEKRMIDGWARELRAPAATASR